MNNREILLPRSIVETTADRNGVMANKCYRGMLNKKISGRCVRIGTRKVHWMEEVSGHSVEASKKIIVVVIPEVQALGVVRLLQESSEVHSSVFEILRAILVFDVIEEASHV